MIKFPDNALDPTSKAWSRKVEDEIRDLRTALNVDGSFSRNSAAGLNGTLRKISEQIAAIEETQAQIQTVVSGLEAQQAELAAQQTQILDLLDSQIVPGHASTVVTGPWSIGSSFDPKAITSIAVPSGYTRAVVYSSGSLSLVNNDTGNTILFGYIDIAGDGGDYQTCYVSNGTYRAPSVVAPAHSRTLTGLSGGSIQLRILGGLSSTSGIDVDLTRAQISGFAIFLR